MKKNTKHHKFCPSCKTLKVKSDFNKHKNRHDGLQSNCRQCLSIKQKKWSKTPEGNNKIKKYRIDHRNELLVYGQKYRKKNRKKITQHEKNRIKSDVNFKIRKLMRSIVISSIKRVSKNNCKYSSTVTQIGCSDQFFKEYIEQKFKPGMTWANHGEWHMDHILPCSSFDLTDPEQQKKCNHYTNLQPLWKNENLIKRDKIL